MRSRGLTQPRHLCWSLPRALHDMIRIGIGIEAETPGGDYGRPEEAWLPLKTYTHLCVGNGARRGSGRGSFCVYGVEKQFVVLSACCAWVCVCVCMKIAHHPGSDLGLLLCLTQ